MIRFLLAISLLLLPCEGKEPQFILYAIPKCGTHYLEHIATLLTGKECFDDVLSEKALKRGRKKILRTFQPYDPNWIDFLKQRNIKVVAIYRDPKDALISQLFHMRKYKGRKRDFFRVSADYDQLSLDEQLERLITGAEDMPSYVDYYMARIGWIEDPYTLALRYEDLVGGAGGGSDAAKREALDAMIAYLGLEVSEEKRAWVLEQMYRKSEDVEAEGKRFVRSRIGGWTKFFKPRHEELWELKNDLLCP